MRRSFFGCAHLAHDTAGVGATVVVAEANECFGGMIGVRFVLGSAV